MNAICAYGFPEAILFDEGDYVLDSFFNGFEMPNDEEYRLFNKVYIVNNIEIDKVVNDIIS